MASDLYPTRTNNELEAFADALNQEYFLGEGHPLTLPIPIEDMAERFLGYSIDITNEGLFSDPNVLGGIDFEQRVIFVNASIEDHEGRYSFTLAHEIGHHALHREAFILGGVRDKNAILCRDAAVKPRIEVEADRFAAALLMPSQSIHAALQTFPTKPKVRTIGQARGLASDLIGRAQFANVSNSAMVNRLIDLNVVPGFIGYQTGRHGRRRARPSLYTLFRHTMARFGI